MIFALTHIFLSCSKKNKNKEDNNKKSKIDSNKSIGKEQVGKYQNDDRKKNIDDGSILFDSIQSGNTKKTLEYADIKIDTKNVDLYGNSNIPAAFSKKYPKYKILFPGCCFEGICINSKCEAYDKYVWSTMGNSRGYHIVKTYCNSNGIKKYTNIGYKNIQSKSLKYAKSHLRKELTYDKDISPNKSGFIIVNLGKEMRNAKCPLCMYYIEKIRACGFSKAIVNVVTKNKNGIASRLFYAINKSGYFIYQKLQYNKINQYRDTELQICYVK